METYKDLAHEIPLKYVDFTVWRVTQGKRKNLEKKLARAYNARPRQRRLHEDAIH